MSEAVIVGGGLAGAAAGALLARAGRRALILEREPGPRDKICGEFLSVEAQAHLRAAGFDLDGLGGAPIGAVRLVAGRRSVESRLPFSALGLSRRRLDEALLDHAERQGAGVERGVTVRRIEAGRLETSAGEIAAPLVLLASGKHEVRGVRRRTEGAMTGAVGFKTYFRLSPAQRAALAGFVEVVAYDGGYAGLQLVDDGVANLCLLVSRARLEASGRGWPALFADLLKEPHLARRLGDAEPLLGKPLTIADVPYGYICGAQDEPPGLFRLGDQAAVIPSFSGDGMSIALHSARRAAEAVLAGVSAPAYHARLKADVGRQVRLAAWLQRRLEGWPGRAASLWLLRLAPGALGRIAAWTRAPAPPVLERSARPII